jgi:hypothetical protein
VLSLRWSYVVWKRRRWRDDETLLARLAKPAANDLCQFGIQAADLSGIAESDVVEATRLSLPVFLIKPKPMRTWCATAAEAW